MDASIVVPVHNSAPHLEECLQSLASQEGLPGAPLPAFEVICVDDGSTDESARILERFAASAANAHLISQPCRGVSAARNAGIEASQGELILFADADDRLDPTLLSRVARRVRDLDADMTIYGFSELYAQADISMPREVCEEASLQDRAFSLQDMKGTSTELVTPNVWRIAFRRSFLERNGIRFREELRTSEDLAFIYECLFRNPRIALLNEWLYFYRRDGGGTLTRSSRGLDGCLALEAIERSLLLNGSSGAENQRHFTNLVLDVFRYALESASTLEEFEALYAQYEKRWRDQVRARLDLVSERYLPFFRATEEASSQDYLWHLYSQHRTSEEGLRTEALRLDAERKAERASLVETQRELDHLASSHAFKVGRALTAPLSRMRALLSRRNNPSLD